MNKSLKIIDFFNSITPLSEEATEFFNEHTRIRKVKKNELLLKKGAIEKSVFFIRSGMIRSYLNKNENSVTTWVNFDGEFATSLSSFFRQQPSECSLDCLEDGAVEEILYDDFLVMVNDFPEIGFIYRILLQEYITRFEDLVYISRIPNSKDRFNKFLQRYPKNYLMRIPKGTLASMLSIRPETLSRIIKEIV